MVGHHGLWPPTASLGTRKDLAGVPGRKVGCCFCQGGSQTLTQFPSGRPRRCALIHIRGAGRNLLVLAVGRANDRVATVPTANPLVHAS